MSDPKEPTIRLCQNCGFRLPYTAAPDDTLCTECRQPKGEPTIRLTSCRGDGRCPECGDTPRPRDPVLLCGCKVDAEACIHGHWGALLTEALRQLSDQRERGDQAEAARATQLTESIEVLQRVEEERDAAIEAQRRNLNEATEAVHDLGVKLDVALQKAEFWKTSDEAWVDVAGRAMALLGHPNSSDLIGVAERIVERMAEVEAERDAALRQVEEQRHPCPCGKDTASIKWARCYSCRQAYHGALRDVETWRAKALRVAAEAEVMEKERDSARGVIEDFREALDRKEEEIAQITRERDEARREAWPAIRKEADDNLLRWRAAEERAEKAEALLRECYRVIGDTDSSVLARTKLLAKIREVLG